MIRSNQVGENDEASSDGDNWQPLSSIPAFASIFGESFVGAAARSKHSGTAPSKGSRSSGQSLSGRVSLGDLGSGDRLRPNLQDISIGHIPMADAGDVSSDWEPDFDDLELGLDDVPGGAADLPAIQVSKQDVLEDLPKPRARRGQDLDELPKPKKKGAAGQDELPKPKKKGAGARDNLPRPQRSSALDAPVKPTLGGDSGLHISLDNNLPSRSRPGSDKPTPSTPLSAVTLPTRKTAPSMDVDDLPRSTIRRSQSADLPNVKPRNKIRLSLSPEPAAASSDGDLPAPQTATGLPSLQDVDPLPSVQEGLLPRVQDVPSASSLGGLERPDSLPLMGHTELPLIQDLPSRTTGYAGPGMFDDDALPLLDEPPVLEPDLPLLDDDPLSSGLDDLGLGIGGSSAAMGGNLDLGLDGGGLGDGLDDLGLSLDGGPSADDLNMDLSPIGGDDLGLGLDLEPAGGLGLDLEPSGGLGLDLEPSDGLGLDLEPSDGLGLDLEPPGLGPDDDLMAELEGPPLEPDALNLDLGLTPDPSIDLGASSPPPRIPSPPKVSREGVSVKSSRGVSSSKVDALKRKAVKSIETPAAKPSSKRPLILGGVALVLLLGGVGAMAALGLGPFASKSAAPPQGASENPSTSSEDSTPSDQPPAPVSLDEVTPELLMADTFASYELFLSNLDGLNADRSSPEYKAVRLAGLSLQMLRYPLEFKQDKARQSELEQLQKQVSAQGSSFWQALALAAWHVSQGEAKDAEPFLQVLVTQTGDKTSYFGHLLRGMASLRSVQAKRFDDDGARIAALEAVEKDLQSAIKADKSAPGAHYMLGRVNELIDKPASARSHYDKAIELNNKHVSAHLRQARLLIQAGDVEDARRLFAKIISKDIESSPLELAHAHYVAGLHGLASNDNETAITEITKAFELSYRTPEVLRDLGLAYERSERYGDGTRFFLDQFGEEPEDPDALLALANLYVAQSKVVARPETQFSFASNYLEKGRERHPNDARFLMALAELYEAQDDLARAEEAYKGVVKLAPDMDVAFVRLAKLLNNRDDDKAKAEARILLEDVANRSRLSIDALTEFGILKIKNNEEQEGLSMLREAIGRNPSWVPAHEALTHYYYSKLDYAKMLEHLDAIKRLSSLTPEMGYLRAQAFYLKGRNTANEEYFKRAEESLADVLRQEPNNPQFVFFSGILKFEFKGYRRARTQFERAIKIDPKMWEAHFYMGRCDLEDNKLNEALRKFKSVSDEQPTNREYGFYVGLTLERMGKEREAIKAYDDILKRRTKEGPESFVNASPLPLFHRGRLQSRAGSARMLKAVQSDLQDALEVQADFIPAQEELARVLFEQRAYEDAVSRILAIDSIHKRPLSADALVILGLSYDRLKNADEALKAFEAALKLDYLDKEGEVVMSGFQERAAIYRSLGFLYRDANRKDDARRAFKKYLDVAKNLDSRERRTIGNEIDRLNR